MEVFSASKPISSKEFVFGKQQKEAECKNNHAQEIM
jgi:hypothetical protein